MHIKNNTQINANGLENNFYVTEEHTQTHINLFYKIQKYDMFSNLKKSFKTHSLFMSTILNQLLRLDGFNLSKWLIYIMSILK